jgi:hypothetical protein
VCSTLERSCCVLMRAERRKTVVIVLFLFLDFLRSSSVGYIPYGVQVHAGSANHYNVNFECFMTLPRIALASSHIKLWFISQACSTNFEKMVSPFFSADLCSFTLVNSGLPVSPIYSLPHSHGIEYMASLLVDRLGLNLTSYCIMCHLSYTPL